MTYALCTVLQFWMNTSEYELDKQVMLDTQERTMTISKSCITNPFIIEPSTHN